MQEATIAENQMMPSEGPCPFISVNVRCVKGTSKAPEEPRMSFLKKVRSYLSFSSIKGAVKKSRLHDECPCSSLAGHACPPLHLSVNGLLDTSRIVEQGSQRQSKKSHWKGFSHTRTSLPIANGLSDLG